MAKDKPTIHDESEIEVPAEILEVGFDFPRDIDKIHALELPVEEIPVEELEWHLDLPFFWQPDEPFSLKPRDVLENPGVYKYSMGRIMSVDTSYPIDVMFWKGRWVILDGLHRFCQHFINKDVTVAVRKVPVESKELIMPD
ncbi:MAG TPA: hypothetical protein ENI23_03345 [bacterium]|nr:hypothetical protein [bacterium]